MHSHDDKRAVEPKLLIDIDDVGMEREGREVLSGIDLRVNAGDFVAITGPNGGGKTTLLRIILGLLRPTKGTVTYWNDGVKVSRLAFGYLPQKNQIDSHFPITVDEVVASGLLGFRHIGRDERRERIDRALELIELTELRDRPIGRLSGGQLQRALLGRAIVGDCEVLVLDEPLSYIDKHFEAHLYDIIRQLAQQRTIILVSHEMSTIASMANRHLIIDHTLTECSALHHFVHTECDE